jgi:hydrogenase large subunit
VHAVASVRGVENALGIEIPPNARIIRNLIEGIQYVQDHVIHFYHLTALDWVDIVSALDADPADTSKLAQSISDWPQSSESYFAGVKAKLKSFVEAGQLGPFANGYWGHPAYKLPPEANLMGVAHYLEALDWQREVIRAQTILGGKNPHPQTYLVGGVAITIDPDSIAGINADRLAFLKELFANARDFVAQVHIPDLLAIASFYKDWAALGGGVGNYLSYGDFPEKSINDPSTYFLPGGIILNKDLSNVQEVDQEKIAEYVAHSWYDYTAGDSSALHPWDGETNPDYTGPEPPYQFLNTDSKYSWIKAPRYDGKAMEVGPLARMLVAYAKGQESVKQAVDTALGKLGVGPEALFSTLGRLAARGIETLVVAEKLVGWTDELAANAAAGDLQICNTEKWEPSTWPAEARGWGHTEAPRGGLGHWIVIKDEKIENYQAVVPSTWNGSPRDATGAMGPYEASLIDTPVAEPEQPLEILRTVHSFDPCMACAVHVTDPNGHEITRIRVV